MTLTHFRLSRSIRQRQRRELALAIACTVSVLASGLGCAIAAAIHSEHGPAYAYAFTHGDLSYALLGRLSGQRLCGPGLTYAQGGPMLCTLGGTLIPRPYS